MSARIPPAVRLPEKSLPLIVPLKCPPLKHGDPLKCTAPSSEPPVCVTVSSRPPPTPVPLFQVPVHFPDMSAVGSVEEELPPTPALDPPHPTIPKATQKRMTLRVIPSEWSDRRR